MSPFSSVAIGGPAARLVWLALIHSLWIGLFAASAAALVLRLGSGLSHRARHAILAVAMIVVALGPVAIATSQYLAPSRTEKIAFPFDGATIVVGDGTPPTASANSSGPSSSRMPAGGTRPVDLFQLAGNAIAGTVDAIQGGRPVAVSAWSITVTLLTGLLLLSVVGLRRLCREAESAASPLQVRSRRLARLLRLRKVPRLLVHSRLAEPFLCGVFHPSVLLPKGWTSSASVGSLDAILAHELAHACRGDHLVNLAQRLVEVALFFHPAVHWLSRSLRRERELCADALAVRLTGDPLALAEALQSIARLRLQSPRIPAVGASLGGPSTSLLPRIQELIGMTPTRPRFPFWPFAALPAAGLLALLAAAAGAADDRPATALEEHRVAPKDMTLDVRTEIAVQEDRQICYDVRYVVGLADAWRPLLLPRMKLVQQEADFSAWLIDDNALKDLIKSAQGDARTNVLMAPKVTSFEGAKATITNRTKHYYVSGFEDFEVGGTAIRPIVKEIEAGIVVEMTGTVVAGATRLSVGVEDTALLGLHTMAQEKRVGEQMIRAQYQIPTTAKRNGKVSCKVPEGNHLLISLGLRDRPGSLPGAARLANSLFASVGLPEFQATPDTMETLVLVTPRRILLESEEEPTPPAAHATDQRKGTIGRHRLP